MKPLWHDAIPKPTAPLPIDEHWRRVDLRDLRTMAERFSPRLSAELLKFGKREMRRLQLSPPPLKPNPYNPSGLILKGGGMAWSPREAHEETGGLYPTYGSAL